MSETCGISNRTLTHSRVSDGIISLSLSGVFLEWRMRIQPKADFLIEFEWSVSGVEEENTAESLFIRALVSIHRTCCDLYNGKRILSNHSTAFSVRTPKFLG